MLSILYGFAVTLIAYLIAKPCNRIIPQIPVIVFSMFLCWHFYLHSEFPMKITWMK